MNEHARRRLPAATLIQEKAIDELFEDLMDFPGWDDAHLDEWLDMISLGEANHPVSAHFRAQDEETFAIEITSADKLLNRPKLLSHLLRKLSKVNKRAQERLGRAVLLLAISDGENNPTAYAAEAASAGADQTESASTQVHQSYLPLVQR
jgi:hypothetical protein